MIIYVLTISHKFGVNTYACANEEKAKQELYSYVCCEWDEGLAEQYGRLNTLNRDDAIDAYFDAWGEGLDPEFYSIERTELLR